MRLGRVCFWAVVGLSAGWWLFGDTVARYGGGPTDANTIRFSHFGSYEDFTLWRRIIEAFEGAHPGLHVRQEYVPGWYGRYDTKVRQQILSETLPDVVLMQSAPFVDLSGHFAALDGLIEAKDASALHPTAVESFRTDSDGPCSLRGMPLAGGNLLIYCNDECFAKASRHRGHTVSLPGDDWTMEDFRTLAGELTCDFDGDGQLDQFGFWRPGWVYYLPFLWSFGAELADASGRHWRLVGPEAEAAMTFYRDLVRDRRVCPEPAEVPQLIQDVGFVTGKVAMCVNGPWFQPFLAETEGRTRYSVAPIPRGPAGRMTRIAWDGLCIPAKRAPGRDDAALRFVRFCVSRDVQEMIASTGRSLPALRSALPAFRGAADDPRRARFIEAMSYSRLAPRLTGFDEIDREIRRHLEQWVYGDGSEEAGQFLSALSSNAVISKRFHCGAE